MGSNVNKSQFFSDSADLAMIEAKLLPRNPLVNADPGATCDGKNKTASCCNRVVKYEKVSDLMRQNSERAWEVWVDGLCPGEVYKVSVQRVIETSAGQKTLVSSSSATQICTIFPNIQFRASHGKIFLNYFHLRIYSEFSSNPG